MVSQQLAVVPQEQLQLLRQALVPQGLARLSQSLLLQRARIAMVNPQHVVGRQVQR